MITSLVYNKHTSGYFAAERQSWLPQDFLKYQKRENQESTVLPSHQQEHANSAGEGVIGSQFCSCVSTIELFGQF